jgi:murein DD-endopeptidase MepM/ murein hydrolase activator NlpD
MVRKVEVQVFPETTDPVQYHAFSLWQILVVACAIFFAVVGFCVIDPFSIIKKWTDVSLFRLYAQNKDLQKSLRQVQQETSLAQQKLAENDSLRAHVAQVAGLPQQDSAFVGPDGADDAPFEVGSIGPAPFMKQIRKAHTDFRFLLDTLKRNSSYARTLPLIQPLRHHSMVTSRFAMVHDEHTGEDLPHLGIDYATFEGDTVVAPGAGMIESIVNDKGFGLSMTIVHNERTETFYGHLESALVKAGQSVTRGEPIALVGKSGRAAGPHLHYELRIYGQPVNPENYYITP